MPVLEQFLAPQKIHHPVSQLGLRLRLGSGSEPVSWVG